MIKPAKTSHQLRILADQLEAGNAPEFAMVVIYEDGEVGRAVRHGEHHRGIVGALQELQLDIITGEIE